MPFSAKRKIKIGQLIIQKKQKLSSKIYIGSAIERWTDRKKQHGCKNNTEFAEFLLDRYYIILLKKKYFKL